MPSSLSDIAAWKEVLNLCQHKTDEKVCLLSGPQTHPQNRQNALQALIELGSSFIHLEVPENGKLQAERTTQLGLTPITGNRTAIDTLKQMGLVIDLLGISHSAEQSEILAAGARMLMVIEPPAILRRLIPSKGDKARVLAADTRLRAAKKMLIKSDAGTNLELNVGHFPTLPEYGFADEPGHWDHWPSGFTSTWPEPNKGSGTLVIDVGDMLFPFKMYVQSPITMGIKDGRIHSIEGGFEAEYLKAHMASYNDPDAYAISHVGWGLQPKAKWTALGMLNKDQTLGMDARAFYGNFLFSTGPNAEAGGNNKSLCHIDIPMRNCSVFLDGEPMVLAGQVVPDDQKVETSVS